MIGTSDGAGVGVGVAGGSEDGAEDGAVEEGAAEGDPADGAGSLPHPARPSRPTAAVAASAARSWMRDVDMVDSSSVVRPERASCRSRRSTARPGC
ncbi:MAG: hypothetical protein M3306_19560, partial [Actinomycetota bacterium]|nr:hypothetical protein [Actinomycetota bacterium]